MFLIAEGALLLIHKDDYLSSFKLISFTSILRHTCEIAKKLLRTDNGFHQHLLVFTIYVLDLLKEIIQRRTNFFFEAEVLLLTRSIVSR